MTTSPLAGHPADADASQQRPARVSGGTGGFGRPPAALDLSFLFDVATSAQVASTSTSGAVRPALAGAAATRTVSLSDGTTIAFTVAGAA